MKNIRFIINPISGKGKNLGLAGLIEERTDKSVFEPEIYYTKGPGHATELSREASEKGYYAVVAVGGDGSVNEVGKGLLGSNTAMGIIPRGSGNGLAHHLGIPASLGGALDTIYTGKITRIDSLVVNDQVCMGIAGIGFDAHVAHQFALQGKRGLITYCRVIFNEYGKFVPFEVELELNGQIIRREVLLVTFANSSQYGNRAQIAPLADIRDGEMEICILKKVPVLKTVAFALRLFTRTCHLSSHLEIIKAREVRVTGYKGKVLHIDGEPRNTEESVSVRVNPLSLNVIVK
jgi:diacylglycerol kinase (ATP)